MEKKNKGGRPRKPDGERATINFTMRLRPDLYEDLRQTAERDNRTISSEAERRLSLKAPAPPNDVARLVGLVVNAVEQRAGKEWSADEGVRRKCRAAAEFTLNVLLGSPLAEKSVRSAIDFQVFRLQQQISGKTGMLDQFLEPPSIERAQEMLNQLQDWSEGLRVADEVLGAESTDHEQ